MYELDDALAAAVHGNVHRLDGTLDYSTQAIAAEELRLLHHRHTVAGSLCYTVKI